MRKYHFKIDADLSPKKDGAQSMWGEPAQAIRLKNLRQAAYGAFREDMPLQKYPDHYQYLSWQEQRC